MVERLEPQRRAPGAGPLPPTPSSALVEDLQEYRGGAKKMVGVEHVAALPSDPFDVHEAGALQALEMSGRGRPRVAESMCQVAGRHHTAAGMEGHKYVTPVLVREGTEDLFELVELPQALGPRGQSVSLTWKCGNAMPGPMARSSTRASIRSQSAPTLGWLCARAGASASSH